MDRLVHTTHLEMTDASQSVGWTGERRIVVQPSELPCPEVCRFFYAAVGNDWWWYSRDEWTREQWLTHANRTDLRTWIGTVQGTPIGYFELVSGAKNETEILFFGLLPTFIGRGFGPEFLRAATESAWRGNPSRIWLHTCDLDHPRALANYQAAGFRIFKTTEEIEHLPDQPVNFWPNEVDTEATADTTNTTANTTADTATHITDRD